MARQRTRHRDAGYGSTTTARRQRRPREDGPRKRGRTTTTRTASRGDGNGDRQRRPSRDEQRQAERQRRGDGNSGHDDEHGTRGRPPRQRHDADARQRRQGRHTRQRQRRQATTQPGNTDARQGRHPGNANADKDDHGDRATTTARRRQARTTTATPPRTTQPAAPRPTTATDDRRHRATQRRRQATAPPATTRPARRRDTQRRRRPATASDDRARPRRRRPRRRAAGIPATTGSGDRDDARGRQAPTLARAGARRTEPRQFAAFRREVPDARAASGVLVLEAFASRTDVHRRALTAQSRPEESPHLDSARNGPRRPLDGGRRLSSARRRAGPALRQRHAARTVPLEPDEHRLGLEQHAELARRRARAISVANATSSRAVPPPRFVSASACLPEIAISPRRSPRAKPARSISHAADVLTPPPAREARRRAVVPSRSRTRVSSASNAAGASTGFVKNDPALQVSWSAASSTMPLPRRSSSTASRAAASGTRSPVVDAERPRELRVGDRLRAAASARARTSPRARRADRTA